MEQILVGLSNGKTSFWDPNTKAYITLANKNQLITFDETRQDIGKHLERICHALFAANPSLKLYEGKIPEEAIAHWKAKFRFTGMEIAPNRADKLQAASAPVISAEGMIEGKSLEEAKIVDLEPKDDSNDEQAPELILDFDQEDTQEDTQDANQETIQDEVKIASTPKANRKKTTDK